MLIHKSTSSDGYRRRRSIAGSAVYSYTGNYLQRQRRLQFRFIPAYDMLFNGGTLHAFAIYSYGGVRYSDIGNTQPLTEYYTLDAGERCRSR